MKKQIRRKVRRKEKPTIRLSSALAETLKPLWLSDKAKIVVPPYQLYRWRGPGPRRYFEIEENLTVTFYNSQSVICDCTLPTAPFVKKWIADRGWEPANFERDAASELGSFMHILITAFNIDRKLDLDTVGPRLQDYIGVQARTGNPMYEILQGPNGAYVRPKFIDPGEWEADAKRTMLAFARFVAERQFEPLAIEIPLRSRKHGVATVIDCVGWYLPTPKAKTKVLAIFDWKRARSGFYDSNEIQLGLGALIWEENFSDWPLKAWANWRPLQSARGTYHLKPQTNCRTRKEILTRIALAEMVLGSVPNTAMDISGTLVLGEDPKDLIREVTAQEYVLSQLPAKRKRR